MEIPIGVATTSHWIGEVEGFPLGLGALGLLHGSGEAWAWQEKRETSSASSCSRGVIAWAPQVALLGCRLLQDSGRHNDIVPGGQAQRIPRIHAMSLPGRASSGIIES